jgi:hypothetical protein
MTPNDGAASNLKQIELDITASTADLQQVGGLAKN